jgi:hypothetical protein
LAPAALLMLLGSTAVLHATYGFDFRCRSDTVQRVDPGGAADFCFTIRNTGTERDCYEFNCRVVQEVSNWFAMYCVGGLCAPPGVTLRETLAAGETDTLVHLTVATDTTSGEEIVNLSVRSTGNPTLADSVTTHTLAGTGVEELPCRPPKEEFGLSISPNPVSGRALISYSLPAGSVRARLVLYDVQGRCRLTVAAPANAPGRHDSRWFRPSNLPGGVYILRLNCGRRSVWHKVVIEN